MGYRSDGMMSLTFPKEGNLFAGFMAGLAMTDPQAAEQLKDKFSIIATDTYITALLQFDSWKWCEGYEDIDDLNRLPLAGKNSNKCCVRFIRIGEDDDDFERYQYHCDDCGIGSRGYCNECIDDIYVQWSITTIDTTENLGVEDYFKTLTEGETTWKKL